MYKKYIKRLLDVILSLIALALLSPLLLCIGVLIKLKMGSPVFFKQKRPGYKCKEFYLYKFRTMIAPTDTTGHVLSDEERLSLISTGKNIDVSNDNDRLTSFGKILRATSLDELPELWNILKGDMSFIGPRPLVTIYLPYYTEREMHRHDVRPGLTGLAQVNGRNSADWNMRLNYDVEYVRNITFWMDVKILFKTVSVVLKREGIGQGEEKPIAFNVFRQMELDKKI